MDLDAARDLWQSEPGWLNTASYGLPPTPAWDELQRALGSWRLGRHSWEPWGESVERSRGAFARLVGVAAEDVAIGSTTSELIGVIAAAVPDGGRVVVPEIEFTSNLFPWLVHADRGVEVVTVPTDQLVARIDEGTSLVALSAVQSATGEVADLASVCAAAAAVGALVVVDATQAVGWLPVQARGVDALVCSAYKWLMAPRGTALAYLGPRLRERMRPLNAGWYAGADVYASYYGPPLRLADGGRRFDVSPAWFSWVGAAPALELVEQIGVEAIRAYDVALANRFRAGLGLPDGDSAIVSIAVPDAQQRLAAAGVRAASRAGSARLSFHLYTTAADVDTAVAALLA